MLVIKFAGFLATLFFNYFQCNFGARVWKMYNDKISTVTMKSAILTDAKKDANKEFKKSSWHNSNHERFIITHSVYLFKYDEKDTHLTGLTLQTTSFFIVTIINIIYKYGDSFISFFKYHYLHNIMNKYILNIH